MRRRCRIWWPKQLSSNEPLSSSCLFGWFLSSSSASLDIVVAFACSEVSLSHNQSTFEGILHDTNEKMPKSLQDKSSLCMLGQHAVDLSSAFVQNDGGTFRRNYGQLTCGCHKLGGLLEQCSQASIGNSNWILVANDFCEYDGKIRWIPKLDHIHWNGKIVFLCDVHVILYETPAHGDHHFSLHLWNLSEQVKAPIKRPKWVDELHQKQTSVDLDTVMLAINSAAAAKTFFERRVAATRSFICFSSICMLLTFIWQVLAMSMASLSTLIYIILQVSHSILSYISQSWMYVTLAKIFGSTMIHIRIRCCQILYWPVFLRENGIRSLSCVEYGEKAALQKHYMWSSLAFDILLGNLIGMALLYNAEFACLWVMNFATVITNNLLRSGCVWLMGVPAGFKLNTELAGVLGLISLNAIQIWSALWVFVGFLSIFLIKGLAISGIVFGMTIPAALIKDILLLVTLHVSSLHWLLSGIYSTQIQALAALWRLFRGRKWNPLRQRLDSYDYTVKQHVVGSLLFTLLLLLLPTTSVFYIFFSILNSTISLICILIEIIISVIHATPCNKIVLWLVRRKRFPCGIWFEVVPCFSKEIDSPDKVDYTSQNSQRFQSGEKSSFLVSDIHSNFLSIGELVSPHYRNIFRGVFGSFVAKSIQGVLTGKRVPSALGTTIPSPLPWMFIPCKDYWYLCYDSILACRRT